MMRVIILRRRSMSRVAALLGLAAALLLALLFPPPLSILSSGGQRLVPIYAVETEQQAVAISFDASWGAERTLTILDVLDQFGVKSTFFLVNIWVEDYPELAREIVARGHEIGLHSVSHPHFSELSQEQIRQELEDNFRLIEQTTGYRPQLFRPPYGDYNNTVIEQVNAAGYQCIQWSVDSLDWQDLSPEQICARVLPDIKAGDIVLFHNNGLHTAEALPYVLTELAAKRLAVVPISELLLSGDFYIDANGIQKPSHP